MLTADESAVGLKQIGRIPALTNELREALIYAAESMQKLTQRLEPILTPLPPSPGCENEGKPAVCQSQVADTLQEFIHRARSIGEAAETLVYRSEV